MTRAPRRALLAALAALACGPYADVAQKLDVTARVAGDTWIAAAGDRTEVRVLIVGAPDADGKARFAFSSVHQALSRGNPVFTLQGTWVEVGSAGATTLTVEHDYALLDESDVGLFSRRGTFRTDAPREIAITATRVGGGLVVSGDPDLAGSYVPLLEALGRLGRDRPEDAACAFQVANVGMLMSEGRVLGFGGPGITQYRDPETFVGTVAGSLRISASLSGGFPPDHSTVTVQYDAFQDLGGVRVDGPMITDANSGGNGLMSGVVTFTITPAAADGTPGTPITGTIDYGANAVVISNGSAVDGFYTVSIDGGGAALVPPAARPSPSVSDCLALP